MNIVEHLVELAMEIEKSDPIDFGYLTVDERQLYNITASSVLEMYLSADKEARDEILLASCIKLSVENTVLNLKLMKKA